MIFGKATRPRHRVDDGAEARGVDEIADHVSENRYLTSAIDTSNSRRVDRLGSLQRALGIKCAAPLRCSLCAASCSRRATISNGPHREYRGDVNPIKRRNRISGQFAARMIEMLESPAYRALSRAAHMVISRIEIELAHHGGNDNGRLPVTTNDFVEYGMHRTSVAPAIREAEALGFIRITERGRGGNAEHRSPNLFFLTFAHARDSGKHPPTHDWRRIKTAAEAEQISNAARANKNPHAVADGKRSWRKRQQKAGTENSYVPVHETLPPGKYPGSEISNYRPGGLSVLPSIARVGESPRAIYRGGSAQPGEPVQVTQGMPRRTHIAS